MSRRSPISAAARDSLLALPDAKDGLIRHDTFSEPDYRAAVKPDSGMQIYILKNSQQTGPYDEQQLAELLDASEISYDDLAWVEGMDTWQPLRQMVQRSPAEIPPPVHSGTGSVPADKGKPRYGSPLFCLALLCLGIAGGMILQVGFRSNIPQPPPVDARQIASNSRPGIEVSFNRALQRYTQAIGNGDAQGAAPYAYSFSPDRPAAKGAQPGNLPLGSCKISDIQIFESSSNSHVGNARLTFEVECSVIRDAPPEPVKISIPVLGFSEDSGTTWKFLVVAPQDWDWFHQLAGDRGFAAPILSAQFQIFRDGRWCSLAEIEPKSSGEEPAVPFGIAEQRSLREAAPVLLGIASPRLSLKMGPDPLVWDTSLELPEFRGETCPPCGALQKAAMAAAQKPEPSQDAAAKSAPPQEPGGDVTPPFTGELIALQRGADGGDARALGIIAGLRGGGYMDSDPKAASVAASKSAGENSPFGFYALAKISLDSNAARKNKGKSQEQGVKAFSELKPVAESGGSWAELFLGDLFEPGIGTSKDTSAAAFWYQTSAAHGNGLAQVKLAKYLIGGTVRAPQPVSIPPNLSVLILGDSMSLCGFGKSLDRKFRSVPQGKSVFTYMACGTTPLSWVAKTRTRCGFWSIETIAGDARPKEFQDTYGMRRGHTPHSHAGPKLGELLAQTRPDVLIMQSGTNLFDLFGSRRAVRPDKDGPMLRAFVNPFLAEALHSSAPLRKIYWVGSPTAGRVSKEVQDFVLEQIRACSGTAATVIDSRQYVSYPYRHMQPDHEHFLGEDMDRWAVGIFHFIQEDLAAKPFEALPLIRDVVQFDATASTRQVKKPDESKILVVKAKLALKSKPYDLSELLPYQESLVSYIYDVEQVLQGQYAEKQLHVVHPAHIALKKQPLDEIKAGKTYELRLRELDGSVWQLVKCKDDTNRIELVPYIQAADENRFPNKVER